MAVTGTSEHLHQHDSIFYGLVNPLDAQGNPVVPQAGDLWIVTPAARRHRRYARRVPAPGVDPGQPPGPPGVGHHRPDDAVAARRVRHPRRRHRRLLGRNPVGAGCRPDPAADRCHPRPARFVHPGPTRVDGARQPRRPQRPRRSRPDRPVDHTWRSRHARRRLAGPLERCDVRARSGPDDPRHRRHPWHTGPVHAWRADAPRSDQQGRTRHDPPERAVDDTRRLRHRGKPAVPLRRHGMGERPGPGPARDDRERRRAR